MNISYFISKRYLFSKKRKNIINLISYVSIVGVAVGTIALVVVLSAFNGLASIIEDMIGPFRSDLKVVPVSGKYFSLSDSIEDILKKDTSICYYCRVLEENALIKYDNKQRTVRLKGVPEKYFKDRKLTNKIVEGDSEFKIDNFNYVIVGSGVSRDLGIGLSFVSSVDFYFPKRGKINTLNPANSLTMRYAFPSGIFSLDQEINSRYVYSSINFAESLFDLKDKTSYLEIDLMPNNDLDSLKDRLEDIFGSSFKVLDKYEQNESMYKIMKSEKMVVFFILIFILLIASFNIIGSLTMLILDKKSDINTLKSLGMNKKDIEKIFYKQGWYISIIGCGIGLIIGIGVCLIQEHFGLITVGQNAISNVAYPVKILPQDIIGIVCTVLLIGYIAARYPVRYLINRLIKD